ncbi:MAG: hypothetical protein EHM24_14915, partial [Acidobacteria bacterium]
MRTCHLLLPILAASLLAGMAQTAPPAKVTRTALLAAEASRAATPADLALLFEGAASRSPALQRQAVRALGRLERPDLTARIVPLLAAGDAGVRAEAANALAQAAGQDLAAAAVARQAALKRLPAESDAEARAALCEALGRLPISQPAEFHQVAGALLAASKVRVPNQATGPYWTAANLAEAQEAAVKLEGALRGFEALIRMRGKIAQAGPNVVQRLKEIVMRGAVPRHRRLALLALNPIPNGPDAETLASAASDDDMQVRRLAAASPGAASASLARAMSDPAPMVRYEALRAWGRRFQGVEGCAPALRAMGEVDGHTALLAIDLLANCAADAVAVDALSRLVGGTSWTGPGEGQHWHRSAHALVALAKISPDRARPHVAQAAKAEAWQVRMYAAAAAAALADGGTLKALASDAHANVREA